MSALPLLTLLLHAGATYQQTLECQGSYCIQQVDPGLSISPNPLPKLELGVCDSDRTNCRPLITPPGFRPSTATSAFEVVRPSGTRIRIQCQPGALIRGPLRIVVDGQTMLESSSDTEISCEAPTTPTSTPQQ